MTKEVGKLAEDAAARHLIAKGFFIIARNVVYPFGEIDLIARDKSTLVFVEVKFRKNLSFGYPDEAVTPEKIKRLIRAANAYMQSARTQYAAYRFDVISLWGELNNFSLEHFVDAFGEEGW